VLETHPQWVDGGWIEGDYPKTQGFTIEKGDRFVARVGFLAGAQAGDVTFSFLLRCGFEEFAFLVGEVHDAYDGVVRTWELPLDEFAGERCESYLLVDAGETSARDWAVWVEAKIVRP